MVPTILRSPTQTLSLLGIHIPASNFFFQYEKYTSVVEILKNMENDK